MKTTLYILFIVTLSQVAVAQTAIEKTFAVQGSNELVVELDHPDLVLETWDKPEVMVKGTVSINNGESDQAFELTSTNTSGVLRIISVIRDKDRLPKYTTIKKGDKEYTFKGENLNSAELQKFFEENGKDFTYISSGLVIDIKLQLFVPRSLRTTIISKYGLVEFKRFEAPLKVQAKYGKVDATIPSAIGDLTARTHHGEIFSNLDIKFDQQPFEISRSSKWTEITARPGKGQTYVIESKYGEVYLRKPN